MKVDHNQWVFEGVTPLNIKFIGVKKEKEKNYIPY